MSARAPERDPSNGDTIAIEFYISLRVVGG